MHPTKEELDSRLREIDISKATAFPAFDDGYLDEAAVRARFRDDLIWANEADRRALLEETTLARETELAARQTRRDELRKIYSLYYQKWQDHRHLREEEHRRSTKAKEYIGSSVSSSSSGSGSSSDTDSDTPPVMDTSSESDDGDRGARMRRGDSVPSFERRGKLPSRADLEKGFVRQARLLSWAERSGLESIVVGALVKVTGGIAEVVGVEECAQYTYRGYRIANVLEVEVFKEKGGTDMLSVKLEEVLDEPLTQADMKWLLAHRKCPGQKELRQLATRLEGASRSEETHEHLANRRFKSALVGGSRLHVESVLHEHVEILKRIEKEAKTNPELESALEKQKARVAQLETRLAIMSGADAPAMPTRVETNEEKMQKQLEKLKKRAQELPKPPARPSEEKLSTTAGVGAAVDRALEGLNGLFGGGDDEEEDGDDR
jgi:ribosome-associated translation inhibitor RaiA